LQTGAIVTCPMSSLLRFLVLSLCLSVIAKPNARADSLLSPEDAVFLHQQAARVVGLARVAPGEKSGSATNTTPYVMHLPDSHRAYTAFWVRDSNMALGADFVPADDVRDWIKLIASTIPSKDWQLRPGVRVPAYFVPDHVNFDGKATFFPASYDETNQQGGGEWGSLPPFDDNYFFLFTVSEYAEMTKSTRLFKSLITTSTGPMLFSDLCLKVFDAIPNDAATGIPLDGDVFQPNKWGKDFGFCDTVQKSGKLLFTALLKYDAALRLAPLYRKIGNSVVADHLDQTAELIKQNLVSTFYHDSEHPGEGWLYSATGVGNQPDVWGSAYAVAVGAVQGETAQKLARSLLRGYRDHSLVRDGCVSEVLQHDPANPKGWQNCVVPFGTYQNGAYWPAGTGWYVMALNTIDPSAARAMAKDYVEFIRANQLKDGTSQAWEWFNPGAHHYEHPQYMASIAFAYGLWNRAGLLGNAK
jgi:hypothetical protein